MRSVIKLDPLLSFDTNKSNSSVAEKAFPTNNAQRRSSSSSPSAEQLVFHIDGEDSALSDPLDTLTVDKFKSFFTPASILELALQKNASHAFKISHGCIYESANVLERYGYKVSIGKSRAAAGNTPASFYSLHHEFVVISLGAENYVVDASFKGHFLLNSPTERFQTLLDAVPSVVVAPMDRFLKAVTFITLELSRCFLLQDLDLPPWRKLKSTLSKWQDAIFVENISPPTSIKTAINTVNAKKSQLRIAEKLIRLGLPAVDSTSSDSENEETHVSLKPTAVTKKVHHDDLDGQSPASVLETQSSESPRHAHKVYYGFHIATASHECLCCGLRRRAQRELALKSASSLWTYNDMAAAA